MSTRYVYENTLSPEELKKCYSEFREKLQTVLYHMEQCVYYLNYINNDLFDVYSIDGEKLNSIKIETMKKNIKQRTSYLRYTIIPELRKMENSL